MALSVLSNYAAQVAHQNLVNSQQAASQTIAQLASGQRIVNASTDPASLAIGSGLKAEVAALNQANINAGQGVSVLQIADGAYSNINDILVQLKTLAIQASSGQLDGTDRAQINSEYTNLVSEVDRIANVTDFNGTQLINGGFSITGGTGLTTSAGVQGITLRGGESAGNYSASYDGASHTFTVANSGETFTGAVAASALSGSGTNATLTQGTVVTLTSTTAGSTDSIDIALDSAFAAGTNIAAAANLTAAGTSSQSFAFQVGAGNTANDQIGVTLNSASASALGIENTDVSTISDAQNASTLITNAINQLQTFRATVGAGESRLQFAQNNISTASENLQSAQSNLLDVDVAQAVTSLTSQQILVQLGVSALAQANQLPQDLLKLLQ
ncbi:MAG TPA: flagellin [Alphaproteobacteria bacterium]|nr:flagellin [Alphaproteobacteria bacterium]